VLKEDVKFWTNHFRKHKINVFINKPQSAISEFIVLFPQERFNYDIYNNTPVDKLNEVTRFCEKNIDTFEYPLAYLKSKFGIKTNEKIDRRVLEEAARVI
jgi:hypothetical protein